MRILEEPSVRWSKRVLVKRRAYAQVVPGWQFIGAVWLDDGNIEEVPRRGASAEDRLYHMDRARHIEGGAPVFCVMSDPLDAELSDFIAPLVSACRGACGRRARPAPEPPVPVPLRATEFVDDTDGRSRFSRSTELALRALDWEAPPAASATMGSPAGRSSRAWRRAFAPWRFRRGRIQSRLRSHRLVAAARAAGALSIYGMTPTPGTLVKLEEYLALVVVAEFATGSPCLLIGDGRVPRLLVPYRESLAVELVVRCHETGRDPATWVQAGYLVA